MPSCCMRLMDGEVGAFELELENAIKHRRKLQISREFGECKFYDSLKLQSKRCSWCFIGCFGESIDLTIYGYFSLWLLFYWLLLSGLGHCTLDLLQSTFHQLRRTRLVIYFQSNWNASSKLQRVKPEILEKQASEINPSAWLKIASNTGRGGSRREILCFFVTERLVKRSRE